jgi:hypothetical protein
VIEAGNDPKERAFPAAAGPENGHEIILRDIQIGGLKRKRAPG